MQSYKSPLGAHSCNANCAGKRQTHMWWNSHAFCSHLVDVMLRPAAHASRLTGNIMQRWVSFRSVLRCQSGLAPNKELLRVRSGWHGINLKAYSSTVYFAYHTFGYYKIKQMTLVLNKGKSNLNFPDARTHICHAVWWPSPTSRVSCAVIQASSLLSSKWTVPVGQAAPECHGHSSPHCWQIPASQLAATWAAKQARVATPALGLLIRIIPISRAKSVLLYV